MDSCIAIARINLTTEQTALRFESSFSSFVYILYRSRVFWISERISLAVSLANLINSPSVKCSPKCTVSTPLLIRLDRKQEYCNSLACYSLYYTTSNTGLPPTISESGYCFSQLPCCIVKVCRHPRVQAFTSLTSVAYENVVSIVSLHV